MKVLKKSVAYRVYSFLIMGVFFYTITGSVKEMSIYTLAVEGVKTIQYSIFEFFWSPR